MDLVQKSELNGKYCHVKSQLREKWQVMLLNSRDEVYNVPTKNLIGVGLKDSSASWLARPPVPAAAVLDGPLLDVALELCSV